MTHFCFELKDQQLLFLFLLALYDSAMNVLGRKFILLFLGILKISFKA